MIDDIEQMIRNIENPNTFIYGNTKKEDIIYVLKRCEKIIESTSKKKNRNHYQHGMTNTRLYRTWKNMRNRCNNPNTYAYKNYGARGIRVCAAWEESFLEFYNWAIANGYDDTLTIDRIDVDGNYEPNNCRWATLKEQNNNMRTNHKLEAFGEVHTIAEWCDITGLTYYCLTSRIKNNWNIEKALSTPQQNRV